MRLTSTFTQRRPIPPINVGRAEVVARTAASSMRKEIAGCVLPSIREKGSTSKVWLAFRLLRLGCLLCRACVCVVVCVGGLGLGLELGWEGGGVEDKNET